LYFAALTVLWSSALLSTGLGSGGRNGYRASIPVQLLGVVTLLLFVGLFMRGFFLFRWWVPPIWAVLAVGAAVWAEGFIPSRIRGGLSVALALIGIALAYALFQPSAFAHAM
jgi:hypothetical protein